MTDAVVAQVRRHAGPAVSVTGVTAPEGPAVIATRETFAAGARSGQEAARIHAAGHDAMILACFGDPGLAAIQSACAVPVVGLAQASFHRVLALERPWAIVTAGEAWRPILREIVVGFHAQRDFLDVEVFDGTGLDALRDAGSFRERAQSAVRAAEAKGARAIVLGGAAFAGVAGSLESTAIVLDCIACATDAALAAVGAARR